MKNKIHLILFVVIFAHAQLVAQNYEDMSKRELRKVVPQFLKQIDSLKQENSELQNRQIDLQGKQSVFVAENEKKLTTYESEILKLNNMLLEEKSKLDHLKADVMVNNTRLNNRLSMLKDTVMHLNNKIVVYNDSVLKLNKLISENPLTLKDGSDESKKSGSDFLNNYYVKQAPLNNNSFILVLNKLICFSDKQKNNYKNICNNYSEVLDKNDINYWVGDATTGKYNDGSFILKNSAYFDSNFPSIKILENKLFKLIYNNGEEEAFLFNILSENNHHQRVSFQIELKSDDKITRDYNNSPDITWCFWVIEKECYLSLDYSQLTRLRLKNINNGINALENQNYNYNDGNGIYFSRTNKALLSPSNYINPNDLVFLFKLKQINNK
jgi:hypothetical protein